MRQLKCKLLLLFFTLVLFFVPKANKLLAQSSNLTVESYDMLIKLSSPKISPNGTKVLLISKKPNTDLNTYTNTLWLIDIQTKETFPLTYNTTYISHPEWSPNGQYISFITQGKNKKRQIFKVSVSSNKIQQITHSSEGIITYKWSPDGELFAFVQKDTPLSNSNNYNKSFEVGHDSYLAKKAAQPAHIWTCSVDGNNEQQLTFGESGFNSFTGDIEWSPDSKHIVFIEQPKPHLSEFLKSSLQLVNINTKNITTLDKGFNLPVNPSFSKDGSVISYNKVIDKEPLFNPHGLFTLDLKTRKSKYISHNIDRHINDHLQFSNAEFLIGTPDGTRVSLWRVQSNGSFKKLDTKNIIPSLNDIDIGPTDKIIFVGSTSQEAPELYYLKDSTSIPKKITSFNSVVSKLNLGKVSSVNWKSDDGFYSDGVITYPPSFSPDKKYPLVLYIHGGPMASSVEKFSFFAQALAAQGWVVFQPNYRGSNNLGKAYQSAIINDAGEGPGKDIMTGIKAITKLGFIDNSKMAVSGWSYGGFMTVWLTSHYQSWKAAVAGAAVTDWFDWYSMADMNIWSAYGLGGSPWTNNNAENYRKQSPITYAHQIKTPTLILSNILDQRVTVSQSFKLFYNLKDNGIETKFIAYPLPGHFPQDPIHKKDIYKRWIEWIKKHF